MRFVNSGNIRDGIPTHILKEREARVERDILALLPKYPQGLQSRKIWEEIKVNYTEDTSYSFVKNALERLIHNKSIKMRGNGFRNNPYRYYIG